MKSGRICEGYLPSSNSTHTAVGHRFVHYIAPPRETTTPSPLAVPSQHTDLDLPALRSLDFFLNSTANQLEQPFGLGLWSQAISCLLHVQPAVKHGLIALAAFHENYQHATKSPFADRRRLLALEHYGKSISGIVHLRLEDARNSLGPTLVASLLFCLIESLQGHFSSAIRHVAAGLEMLTQCESDTTLVDCLPGNLFEALSYIFMSLGMQALAMESDVVEPVLYRYVDQSHFRTSCNFLNIDQALAKMAHLQIDTMRVMAWADSSRNDADFPWPSLQQAGRALNERFDTWVMTLTNFTMATERLTRDEWYRTRLAQLTLRLNQHVTKILLHVIFQPYQTAYDSLVDEFDGLMNSAEEITRIESQYATETGAFEHPMFNMAIGIVPAVFHTCIRCRDHSIRHRALSYLKETKRREVLWDTAVVASVAEKVVQFEEAAAMHYSISAGNRSPELWSPCAGDITLSLSKLPDAQRIKRLEVNFLDCETAAKVELVNAGGAAQGQTLIMWDG